MTTTSQCSHCGASVQFVKMTEQAWAAMTRCLQQGSQSLAAAELVALGLADPALARRHVEHLMACIFSWPVDPELQPILYRIDSAFGDLPKPDHFTDFAHCDECRDHDETLRRRSLKTITRADLGGQGWNPICFATDEGQAYYIPALVRFAVAPSVWPDRDPYVFLLASTLSWEGRSNELLNFCNYVQRCAIADFIDWCANNESKIDCQPLGERDFMGAWKNWEEGAMIWRDYSGSMGEP